jgi:hypothetical protein
MVNISQKTSSAIAGTWTCADLDPVSRWRAEHDPTFCAKTDRSGPHGPAFRQATALTQRAVSVFVKGNCAFAQIPISSSTLRGWDGQTCGYRGNQSLSGRSLGYRQKVVSSEFEERIECSSETLSGIINVIRAIQFKVFNSMIDITLFSSVNPDRTHISR